MRELDDPLLHHADRIDDRPAVHDVLRRTGRVVAVEAPAGGPAWVVTDEALAQSVLGDRRFAKDPGLAPAHWHGSDPTLEPPAAARRSITTLEGEEHRMLRRLLAPMFSRRRLLSGADKLAGLARSLLAELAAESDRTGTPIDLVERFCGRYPLLAACHAIGLDTGDDQRITWVAETLGQHDFTSLHAALAELESIASDAITAARTDDESSLAAVLQQARADDVDLSDHDLSYLLAGVLFAGQVTSQSFLSYLLAYRLAGYAGQDAEPGADERFVDEVLRLHPPAPFTLWRFTTEPVDLDGVRLPAGAPVLIDIEGLNTDPRRISEPTTLRPDRRRLPDLTFGSGPHVCIGAQLARLEGCAVLEVLRTDFPDARLAVEFSDVRRAPGNSQSRPLAELPMWPGRRRPD